MDRSRNLLLVEDDETTRELLTILLTDAGWIVTATQSGEDALAWLTDPAHRNSAARGVVLCDQHLPGIQGTDLARAVRALCPDADLIAMSATPTPAIPDGYDEFLTKPFPAPALDDVLTRNIPRTEILPAQVAAAPQAVLNLDVVTRLRSTMGSGARGLVEFALADAGERISAMRTAVEGGRDLAAFHKQAHALKGSAGMIGAEKLAGLAAEAESADICPGAAAPRLQIDAMQLACAEIGRMLETLFPAN